LANGDTIAAVETDAAQVLALARRAAGPDADDRILQGARSMRAVTHVPSARPQSPAVGRRLNSEARAAWERQDIDTALRLQQRAFEASPNDPEIVGNLAFFYLKAKPAQPALARRLALHALGARGSAFPAGRAEDWGTLAVASSLLGREGCYRLNVRDVGDEQQPGACLSCGPDGGGAVRPTDAGTCKRLAVAHPRARRSAGSPELRMK